MSETFALLLAYDGAAFKGWQRQPGMPTVQAALEDALWELVGRRSPVQGASRTDAGVHALGQVASFRSDRRPEMDRLRLPGPVRFLRWSKAHPSFHARASAIGKRYRYDLRHFLPGNPDWDRAREAMRGLEDLPHLSGLSSPAKDHKPAPPLDRWSLGDDGLLEVCARAFRKHQVRNLAGHLGAVALGLATPASLRELARRSRPWMAARAPAGGLTLLEVLYPPGLDPFH